MNSLFKFGSATRAISRPTHQRAFKRNVQTIRSQLTIPPTVTNVKVKDQNAHIRETLSGVPAGFYDRKVKITRPDPFYEQYGRYCTTKWEVSFVSLGGDNYSHGITGFGGWTSSAGRFMRLQFFDKEQAIQWAEREGFDYEIIDKPQQLIQPIKNYGDNFKYKPPTDD